MAKQEYPIDYLANYLPPGATPMVLQLLHQYKVHLTITRERKSVLGDYRHAHQHLSHRISVNGNLNKYAFLITLVHEIAHLVTFTQYHNRVAAHGKEWKNNYRQLLLLFLPSAIFPVDVQAALESSLHNLPASSCADEGLMRVLRNYDTKEEGMYLVEDLPEGSLFALADGQVFKKGKKLRKRIQCVAVHTGKLYLFSPVYEVKMVS